MRWTIAAKLTGLVLAVLLPLMAAAGVKFWLEGEQTREDAQADMLESAQAIAQLFDEILTGQIENLEALASVRALDRIQDDDLVGAAARIKARHGFVRRFVAVGPDGAIVATSEDGGARAGAAFSAPDLLQAALRDRLPQVGAPRGPSGDGRMTVPIVAPMLDRDGAALGGVAVEIDLGALSAYLDRVPLAHGTSSAIVTADGVLVAGTRGTPDVLGRTLALPPAAAILLRNRTGVAEWTWQNGLPTLTGAAPLSRAPWVALAGIARDAAYAPVTTGLRRNLIGLGVVTLAALLAAWLISRRMTRSVRALIDGARGLAAGTGGPIAVATGDELAEVAAQINRGMEERRAAEVAVTVRQRRIRALADVNRSISQQLDLEPLLRQITRAVAQLTGADNAVLWEADPARRTLTRRATTTAAAVGTVDLPMVLTFAEGATGWIARHRAPLFVEDVGADPRIMAAAWAVSRDLVAFAGAPVVAGDELLGVLTLNLKRGLLLQGDDRLLLSSFASQAAVAIVNARLFADAEARRRVAETSSDLGRALSQALEVDVVARIVADGVRTLLGGQDAGFFRLDADSGATVALATCGALRPASAPFTLPAGMGVIGLAIRERRPVTTANVLADERVTLPPRMRERIEASPIRAILSVPLVAKDRVIGALGVADREGRVFTPDEIRAAQAFADQAALALDNARLYEEAHERVRHLDSLRDVVEQILVPISLDARLHVIAEKAAALFAADRAAIALYEADDDALVVRAGWRLAEGEIGRVLPRGVGATSAAAAARRGALVEDDPTWARDPFGATAHADPSATAVMAVPLLIRGQLIGVLALVRHGADRRFGAADLDRLASLAVPAALAIEHSRLYEDLQSHVRELEATQAQLVQAGKLSAVGQLVSGVAHELNNPLSVILGYAQLLAERDLPADVRRPIEVMLAQGARMTKIVQSLLLFSRQRRPERSAVDVREAIEQPLGLRATQLALSGVRVVATYGEGVPAAVGDAHQLQQVFLNLILNAEQAILSSGAGGARVGDALHVTTGTRVDGDRTWVVITIADNGPGIPADVLPRIFEPFYTTKKVGEGTGLGLSVSHGIIEQHGGSLTVESRPGRTVFTIELPAVTSPPRPRAIDRPVAVGAGRGRHALVVDDEPGVLELVSALLEQAGWQVETATGGRAALERVRGGRYDLVLTDLRMPEGSGEDLFRAIAAERREMVERVLFMTGDTANPEAWGFIEAMRATVIEKPFTAQALLSAVERVAA